MVIGANSSGPAVNAGYAPSYNNQLNNNYYGGSNQMLPPPPPPVFGQPLYAQQQQQQQPVMLINGQNGPAPVTVVYFQAPPTAKNPCPYCGTHSSIISRKRKGCALLVWFFALLLLTGCCCWVACCIDDCFDMQYICTHCQRTRGYVKSPYGC